MRIAIVAGEPSGDLLGASLIQSIKARRPDARFQGVGGPLMIEQGCESLHPLDALSVMGLAEVLVHLPRLMRIRADLIRCFLADPPDVFIGIDAPDFNLGLERRLRAAGVPTVHYVSPSVWAWRQGRIKGIRESVDLMLTLFPFEEAFYRQNGVRAVHVGHPAADRIPLEVEPERFRRELGIGEGPLVALLPGSRASEVSRLGPVFAAAAARIRQARPDCRFVAAMVRPALREQFQAQLAAAGVADAVQLVEGRSTAVMGAADCVLLASGTATLEAMLLKRPMVVAYRLAPATYWLVRSLRLVKIGRFALPNLLAGEDLVPEFIQDAATPEALAAAVLQRLTDADGRERLQSRFHELHRELRRGASDRGAEAILQWLSASN